jgi:hypothetical protein
MIFYDKRLLTFENTMETSAASLHESQATSNTHTTTEKVSLIC